MDATEERGKSSLREVVGLIPRGDATSFETLRRFRLGEVLDVAHIDPLRDAGLIDGNAMLTEKGTTLAFEMIQRSDD